MKEYKKRFHRLMRLILEIKTDPHQTVSDLLDNLQISKAQFYKDRKALSEIGFQFDYSRSLKKFVINKDISFPVENLTISEQLSLVMALRHLSASGDHILTYEGFRAARKIASQLPENLREHLFEDWVIEKGFHCNSTLLDKLQKAVTENWRIVFSYQKPENDTPTREEIDPYHIFFKRRALYVEGYSWKENDIRTYRLSRILSVEFKSKGFAVREDYNFGKRYKNAFSAFPGETVTSVTVKFTRKVRPYIEETIWHHSQKLSRQNDGSLIFSVSVAEPKEVLWWSFFWGAEAEILEPEWLREEAAREAEKINRNYKKF